MSIFSRQAHPIGWATDEWGKFERVVFSVKNCVVVWDEGTSTGGCDRENVKLFTAIRHHHPVLFFVGHDLTSLLPIMRGSLTDLILFRCDPDDADKWARKFTDRDLMQATELGQFEAIHKRAFRPVRRLKFTPAQLAAGIIL